MTDSVQDFFREAPVWVFLFAFGIPALLACIGLIAAGWSWRNARALQSLPATPVSQLSQGYVLVQGHVAPDAKVTAPLTGRICAWYEVKVEEAVKSVSNPTATGDRRVDYSWTSVRHDSSHKPLRVFDRDAQCVVHPDDATVYATDWSEWYGATKKPEDRDPVKAAGHLTPGGGGRFETHGSGSNKFRYLERYIYAGDPIFVMGMASREQSKGDSSSLIITAPADRRPFIISTRSPDAILSENRLAIQGGVIMAVVMGAISVFIWTLRFH
jgi:hypothetical protein